MLSQQTPYTTPPIEGRPQIPVPPAVPQQVGIAYNEQFIETLVQRLMPEILYYVRKEAPARARSRGFGMSLALAITHHKRLTAWRCPCHRYHTWRFALPILR